MNVNLLLKVITVYGRGKFVHRFDNDTKKRKFHLITL